MLLKAFQITKSYLSVAIRPTLDTDGRWMRHGPEHHRLQMCAYCPVPTVVAMLQTQHCCPFNRSLWRTQNFWAPLLFPGTVLGLTRAKRCDEIMLCVLC